MEAFPHVTQRNDRHICLKFLERPSKSLIQLLKTHGSYRPLGNQQSAWQFKSNRWASLYRDLVRAHHHDIALAVRRVMMLWNASKAEEQASALVESTESSDSDVE